MTSSSNTTPSRSGEPDAHATGDTLDLCGQECPYTFVHTRLKLEAMAMGSRLTVVVDHEPAARNIPRSARDWGQEVESVTRSGDRWHIAIRKRVD